MKTSFISIIYYSENVQKLQIFIDSNQISMVQFNFYSYSFLNIWSRKEFMFFNKIQTPIRRLLRNFFFYLFYNVNKKVADHLNTDDFVRFRNFYTFHGVSMSFGWWKEISLFPWHSLFFCPEAPNPPCFSLYGFVIH